MHRKAQPLQFHVPDWPVSIPDVLLVPLLAFDTSGYRLGYRGGYYDRTLEILRASHPVLAIGIAFAGQEIEDVLHDSGDQQLDVIVTEADVRRFRPRGSG